MRDRANEIIVNLIRSNDFKDCIGKVKPSDLQEDLKAEVSLILLETAPEKIITLSDKKQLNFYTVRIIMNLAFSNTSPFYRKYRTRLLEFREINLTDDNSLFYRMEKEKTEEIALREIDNLEWFDSEMMKLYLQAGTFRNMQKATLIPYQTCHKTVTRAIDKIKKKVVWQTVNTVAPVAEKQYQFYDDQTGKEFKDYGNTNKSYTYFKEI